MALNRDLGSRGTVLGMGTKKKHLSKLGWKWKN